MQVTAVLTPAVAVGLILLLWASSSGPVPVLSPSGRRYTSFDRPQEQPSTPPPADPQRGGGEDLQRTLDLSWIGELLSWAVLVAGTLAVALAARWVWRHRWRAPLAPDQAPVDVLPEARLTEELRGDARAHLAALDQGSPRNGIVRCWLRLEESVAEAGLPRQRHETATEYAVRVLREIDLDPRPVGELAALYREARFSDHPLDEDSRERARAALALLHEELRALGAPR